MDSHSKRCCGREMSGIGLEREDGVVLRSCPSCGRHAWFRGDHELDRAELLDALRRAPQPSRPAPARRPRRTAPVPTAQREELQELLRGFTVHGA